jgi:hypothetical protein
VIPELVIVSTGRISQPLDAVMDSFLGLIGPYWSLRTCRSPLVFVIL